MFKQLNKNKSGLDPSATKSQSGFTIIEVLIVLAIAGLIMVVVFLAVPALQRNSRNSQRDADAQRITSAVNECVGNNNGQTGSCDDFPGSGGELYEYITPSENQQLTAYNTGTPTSDDALDDFSIDFATACDSSGTGTESAPARAFVVTYRVETTNGDTLQCIGG